LSHPSLYAAFKEEKKTLFETLTNQSKKKTNLSNNHTKEHSPASLLLLIDFHKS